jgi:hypothetical protein
MGKINCSLFKFIIDEKINIYTDLIQPITTLHQTQLTFIFSVLFFRFTTYEYPFGIFKLFLLDFITILSNLHHCNVTIKIN